MPDEEPVTTATLVDNSRCDKFALLLHKSASLRRFRARPMIPFFGFCEVL
jgi:hypothetical protein